MSMFICLILFLIGFYIFSGLFNNIIVVLILCYQLCISGNFLFNLIISKIKRKTELNEIEKIEKNDKEKFKYFRDILTEYTIGELGYLFNETNNLKLLISADLENLKRKKKIRIDENGLEILDNTNLSKSEEFLIKKYKFLDDYQFEQYYIKNIEASLKEKNCIQNYKNEVDFKIIIMYLLNFISFVIPFNASRIFGIQSTLLLGIEGLMVVFTFFTLVFGSLFMMDIESKKYTKTEKGKEIYLKLNGLKNFLKDFSNFEEKTLNEISVWNEYVLYAIILNESQNLTQELQNKMDKNPNLL